MARLHSGRASSAATHVCSNRPARPDGGLCTWAWMPPPPPLGRCNRDPGARAWRPVTVRSSARKTTGSTSTSAASPPVRGTACGSPAPRLSRPSRPWWSSGLRATTSRGRCTSRWKILSSPANCSWLTTHLSALAANETSAAAFPSGITFFWSTYDTSRNVSLGDCGGWRSRHEGDSTTGDAVPHRTDSSAPQARSQSSKSTLDAPIT